MAAHGDQNKDAGRHDAEVIIAGGGPIGMSLGIDLSLRGIQVLIIEQREHGESFPARTNLINARSMTLFRRWGIADSMRANDPVPDDFARDVTFVTRATGQILINLEGGCEWREKMDATPELPEWAPNPAIEKTLRERVEELEGLGNLTMRWGSTVTDFFQSDEAVSVTFAGPDGPETVTGPYLVAADGSRSVVRKSMNVGLPGRALAQSAAWHFYAPELRDLFTVPLSTLVWFVNEDAHGAALRVQDGDGHWLYSCSPLPPGVEGDDWEAIKKLLFRSIGAEFEVEPVRGGAWVTHARMAPRYDFGRVFLAGDAAHLTSPMGGFGMNMGIGDAADLGWKLAATLRGWGGPRLLETYTIERQEAERFIIDGSTHNQSVLAPEIAQPQMEEDSERGERARAKTIQMIVDHKTAEFKSFGAQFGYRYESSPLILREAGEGPPLDYGDYVPSARPGYLAPHVWLGNDSSLYDHLGSGFCLLRLDPTVEVEALEVAAAARALPLIVFDLKSAEAERLYEAKLTLIRPDQHVAWRGQALPDDCDRLLDLVRGALAYSADPKE